MSAVPPIVVRRRIAADHPAFAGHFPGRPILPGVLLLAEVLEVLHARGEAFVEGVDIGSAKFLAPVGPGDELTITLHPGAGGWRFDVHVGVRRAATGTVARPAAASP